jgi:hypothetical protein
LACSWLLLFQVHQVLLEPVVSQWDRGLVPALPLK